jgi:drug/metabolite transporter (DMT)-like permease
VSRIGNLLGRLTSIRPWRLRLRVVPSIDRGARTWLNQATGAVVRAFLVMVVIVLPSVVLPGIGTDTRQIVALMALFAGALVFAEYNAVYPSLIEFRDGAPFNRIRYLMLLAIVLFLSVAIADLEQSSTVSRLIRVLGNRRCVLPL